MKIAESIKSKDFSLKWVWHRQNIQGRENAGYYEIWFQGKKKIGTAPTKKEAQRIISQKVKDVNRILEAARKKYNNQ